MQSEDWGLLEPLRGPLGPICDIMKPLISTNLVITVLCLTILLIWYRSSSGRTVSGVGYPHPSHADRLVAYEEMWHKEESELWEWLEDRIGLDTIMLETSSEQADGKRRSKKSAKDGVLKERRKVLKGRDIEAKVREEKMGQREMESMVRIADERLSVLKSVLDKRKVAQETVMGDN